MQAAPDGLCDIADDDSFLADRVQHRAGRCALDAQSNQPGGVGAVNCGLFKLGRAGVA